MPDLKTNQSRGISFLDYTVYQDNLNGESHQIKTKGLQAYGNRYVITHGDIDNSSWETSVVANLTTPLNQNWDATGVTDESLTQAVDLVTKYAYPTYFLNVAKLSAVTQVIPFNIMEDTLSGYGPYWVLWRAYIKCPSTGSAGGTIDVCKMKRDEHIRLRVRVPGANADFFWTLTDRENPSVSSINATKEFYLITGTNNPTSSNIWTTNRPTRVGQKYLRFAVTVIARSGSFLDCSMLVESLEVGKASGYSATNEDFLYIDTIIPYIAVKTNESSPKALQWADPIDESWVRISDPFPLNEPYELGKIITKVGYSRDGLGTTNVYDNEPAFVIDVR